MTNINLELITDIDEYFLVEKGLRGGISYIANRHSKANNKYLKDYKYFLVEKGLRGGISYIANRHSKANNKYLKDYNPNKNPNI